MLHDKYPGLTRGVARLRQVEDVIRLGSMLPLRENINGVDVLRLTPRHFDQLLLVRSVFLISRERRKAFEIRTPVEEIIRFLWIVSPSNRMNQRTWRRFIPLRSSRARFVRQFHKIPFERARHFERAIDRYLGRQWFDKPPGGNGRIVPTAISAAIVHRVAAAYGWLDEKLDCFGLPVPGAGILDMPISRLYQYWRRIAVEADPDTSPFSSLATEYRLRTVAKYLDRARAAGFGADVEQYLALSGKLKGKGRN